MGYDESMDTPRPATKPTLSRREALRLGLVGSTGVILAGCAGAGRSAALPTPRWPERRARRPKPESVYRPPTRPQPEPAGPSASSGQVLPRHAWAGGRPIPARMDRMLPVWRITVHHDGLPPVTLRGRQDVADRIDLIRRSHQQRGWGDIGYHFVVDPEGRLWEGRPLAYQGAHVGATNEGNLGVLCLGNFEIQHPTGAQLSALDGFLIQQMRGYGVTARALHTHRELAPTACPGRNLQAHMDSVRSSGGVLARG